MIQSCSMTKNWWMKHISTWWWICLKNRCRGVRSSASLGTEPVVAVSNLTFICIVIFSAVNIFKCVCTCTYLCCDQRQITSLLLNISQGVRYFQKRVKKHEWGRTLLSLHTCCCGFHKRFNIGSECSICINKYSLNWRGF
jgi:hypothetical protein